MRLALTPHPDRPRPHDTRVEVEIVRSRPGVLAARYQIVADMRDVLVPALTASGRADELWRHTCFEAFVRATREGPYYELNFSPSTRWAAYRFDGYRSGMRPAQDVAPAIIDVDSDAAHLTLRAEVTFDRLADAPDGVPWFVGVSAILESVRGEVSYWSAAHPPGRPDFHHADCFALELPPA